MKERPILFSAPMVRALLDGSKTQTRRVVKPQPPAAVKDFCTYHHPEPGLWFYGWDEADKSLMEWCVKSRHGQPGDRLWVKETFCPIYPQDPSYNGGRPIEYDYAATYTHGDRLGDSLGIKKRWKPSIHMPRAASRITLEIVSVRVERLQDISEDDARAEGCERLNDDEPGYVYREDHDWKICPKCGGTRLHNALGSNLGVIFDVDCLECNTYVKRYRHLWQSINGDGSWDLNPHVWVVEFKVVTL